MGASEFSTRRIVHVAGRFMYREANTTLRPSGGACCNVPSGTLALCRARGVARLAAAGVRKAARIVGMYARVKYESAERAAPYACCEGLRLCARAWLVWTTTTALVDFVPQIVGVCGEVVLGTVALCCG